MIEYKRLLEDKLVEILKNENHKNYFLIWDFIENNYWQNEDGSPIEIFLDYGDLSLLE